MINYDSERGLEVITKANTSTLTIASAEKKHAGNYTCSPSNAKGATIQVFVSASAVDFAAEASYFNPEDGEKQKKGSGTSSSSRSRPTAVVISFIIINCVKLI